MKRPLQVGSIARVDYQSHMTTALLIFVLCLLEHLPIITPDYPPVTKKHFCSFAGVRNTGDGVASTTPQDTPVARRNLESRQREEWAA